MSCIIQEQTDLPLIDWMSNRFPSRTRSQWIMAIENGRVHLNHQQAHCDSRLNSGDLLVTYREEVPEPQVPLVFDVLRETEDWCIVDKPPGLPVHPGGVFYQHTLWYQAKKRWPDLILMNRIDRETSGCVIMAKTKKGNRYWHGLIRDNHLDKEYLCLVHGCPDLEPNTWTEVSGYLTPDTRTSIQKKVLFLTPRESENLPYDLRIPSTTLVRPLSQHGSYTLVQCKLITGKTHQIRATMEALGTPLVGDKMYGTDPNLYVKWIRRELDQGDREALVLDRQALHSWSLSWTDGDGQAYQIRADLPRDMAGIMDRSTE